jgi:hypothetical protein
MRGVMYCSAPTNISRFVINAISGANCKTVLNVPRRLCQVGHSDRVIGLTRRQVALTDCPVHATWPLGVMPWCRLIIITRFKSQIAVQVAATETNIAPRALCLCGTGAAAGGGGVGGFTTSFVLRFFVAVIILIWMKQILQETFVENFKKPKQAPHVSDKKVR